MKAKTIDNLYDLIYKIASQHDIDKETNIGTLTKILNEIKPTGGGNMRWRPLAEGEDYTKNLVLETETIETEELNNHSFNHTNFSVSPSVSEESPTEMFVFLHRAHATAADFAIPLQVNDIASIEFNATPTGGTNWRNAIITAIEPFVAEGGFETKRIVGYFEADDMIVDFHICIGFIYAEGSQTVGIPLLDLRSGGQSSVFLSLRTGTGSGNMLVLGLRISGKNAVNTFPVSLDGRLELKKPLKENERLNVRVSTDVSLLQGSILREFNFVSNAFLAPDGYIDQEVAVSAGFQILAIRFAVLSVLVMVDKNGASFKADGLEIFANITNLTQLQTNFTVKSVEIVEILE